jgi:hypothetical protein
MREQLLISSWKKRKAESGEKKGWKGNMARDAGGESGVNSMCM